MAGAYRYEQADQSFKALESADHIAKDDTRLESFEEKNTSSYGKRGGIFEGHRESLDARSAAASLKKELLGRPLIEEDGMFANGVRLLAGTQGILNRAGFKAFIRIWSSDRDRANEKEAICGLGFRDPTSLDLMHCNLMDAARNNLYLSLIRLRRISSAQGTAFDAYSLRVCLANFYEAYGKVKNLHAKEPPRDTYLEIEEFMLDILKKESRSGSPHELGSHARNAKNLLSKGKRLSSLMKPFGPGILTLIPINRLDAV